MEAGSNRTGVISQLAMVNFTRQLDKDGED